MNQGYVKLYRKALQSGLLQHAKSWQFLCWCLLTATHKPYKRLFNGVIYQLFPGQLVTSREEACAFLRLTPQEYREIMKRLLKAGVLACETNNKGSVISLVNWSAYQEAQPGEQPAGPPVEQPAGNRQTTRLTRARSKKLQEEKKESREESASGREVTHACAQREVPSFPAQRQSFAAMTAGYTKDERLRAVLGDFIAMRQRLRAPMTNAALGLTLRKLDELAGDDEGLKLRIVEQSVEKSWRSVFPLSGQYAGASYVPLRPQVKTFQQMAEDSVFEGFDRLAAEWEREKRYGTGQV